jgi:hypothetical protein
MIEEPEPSGLPGRTVARWHDVAGPGARQTETVTGSPLLSLSAIQLEVGPEKPSRAAVRLTRERHGPKQPDPQAATRAADS